MKKSTLAPAAAALALTGSAAGVVYAQQTGAMPGPMGGMRGMMHDPMGDATVTRAEAQAKAAALFAQHDRNHDGKLDQADRAARIGEHFDKMDANHDGTLSKAEFVAAHEQARADHDGPNHEGRGHKGMMGQHRMGHHGKGHGMMGAGKMGMDANGDHAITRDEFIAGALKRFDTADANHDGKLTKEERRAAMRAHMRDRRAAMHGGMKAAPPPAPKGEHDGHAGAAD